MGKTTNGDRSGTVSRGVLKRRGRKKKGESPSGRKGDGRGKKSCVLYKRASQEQELETNRAFNLREEKEGEVAQAKGLTKRKSWKREKGERDFII